MRIQLQICHRTLCDAATTASTFAAVAASVALIRIALTPGLLLSSPVSRLFEY